MLRACIDCGALCEGKRCADHEHRNRNGSTRAWRKVRAAVLERDNHRCHYCDDPADEVDHVVPVGEGGTDDEENLVAACQFCNRSKHNRGGAPRKKPESRRHRGAQPPTPAAEHSDNSSRAPGSK